MTSLDIFLILAAIVWHDVGMVYGRSGHERRVAEMTEEIKMMAFPNTKIHRFVDEISKAHGGEGGLSIPGAEDHCLVSVKSYPVYPRSLAAVVRFADEVSENQSRISPALLSVIPEENRIFWEYANSIEASTPQPERERVVLNVAIQTDKIAKKFKCPENLRDRADERGQISLIEYILCRLEKMNNERAYCAPEFRRYVFIREIVVRFMILRGTERVERYDNLEVKFGDYGLSQDRYPNIKIFDEFFERYPNWK